MKKSLLFRLQFILVLFLLSGIVRAEAPGNPGAFPETPSAAIPAPSLADSIWLAGDSLTLQEVTVVSNFHSRKSSPLRLNTVDNETIARRATARTYPELIKFIPGVYATAETGSYGDARINIRGFKQENISVLLNGIPISGLTSGNMFWNNWMGLADATYAIQVQKGAGGSMLSDNSVGGTINIITSTTTAEPRIDGGAHVTDYGTGKGYISLNTGDLGHGWSASLLGSYVGGNGYVDRTRVNSWSYMLNVAKRIGERNTLIFTALGSPEQHEQRSVKLSRDEVGTYGLKYNKKWGYRDGKAYNLNKNNNFKPYFTLQHVYAGDRLTMTNSVYLAVGNGGGRWSESKGAAISSYRTADGLVDWEAANITGNDGLPSWPSQLGSFSSMSYTAGAGVYRRINPLLYDKISSTDVRKGWWVDENLSSQMVIPGIITYRRGRFYDGPYMLSSEQIMDYIGYTSYGSVYMRLGALADNYNSRHGYGMRSARPAVLSLGCCTNGLGLAFNF